MLLRRSASVILALFVSSVSAFTLHNLQESKISAKTELLMKKDGVSKDWIKGCSTFVLTITLSINGFETNAMDFSPRPLSIGK